MKDKERNMIVRQLNAAASEIEKMDSENDPQIIEAGYRMILQLLPRLSTYDRKTRELDKTKLEERVRIFSGLCRAIRGFTDELINLPPTDEQKVSIEKLENEVSELNTRLGTGNKELIDLKEEKAQLSLECKNMDAQLRVRRDSTAQKREEHQRYTEELTRLDAELKKYSDEVLTELKWQNEKLGTDLVERREEFDSNKEQIRQQQEALDKINADIMAQPEELRRLQAEYATLCRLLDEIEHALERCSEEKQQALKEEIERKGPTAKEYQQRHEELTASLEKLNGILEETEKATAETLRDLWERLLAVQAALSGKIGDENAELEHLQGEMEAFNEQILACELRLERLRQWYHAEKTPLELLLEKADGWNPTDQPNQTEQVDLNRVHGLTRLFTQADDAIQELDELLKDAIAAAREDEQLMHRRVDTNERRAREETKRAK